MTTNQSVSRRLADLPRSFAVFVLIASFLLAFGLAAAVAHVRQGEPPAHTGGPVTQRVLAASGVSQEFGTWRLYHSKDADGATCQAIQLFDVGPDKVDPIMESCGAPQQSVASYVEETRTLLRGRVPADVTEVVIKAQGRADRSVKLVAAAGEKAFVTTYKGKITAATAVAKRGSERAQSRLAVALP